MRSGRYVTRGGMIEGEMDERTIGKLTAIFQQTDEWWIGYVEELPGANTQGRTLEEARENLKEAVQLILEANGEPANRADGLTLPQVIEKDEDGYFAYCPPLQGCYTQGDTLEEAIANLKDAISLYSESLTAHGDPLPEEM